MYKAVILIIGITLLQQFNSMAQTVIKDMEIQEVLGGYGEYEFLYESPDDTYILAIENFYADKPGLMVGDTLVPAFHHHPEDIFLALSDFFVCKLSSNYDLMNTFTIDNSELIRDVFAGSDFTLISMNFNDIEEGKDSFPLLLNGQIEIPREGNLGKGAVIVLDNNLQFQRYLIPSTGEIGHVAVDDHLAYFELRIPAKEPYIVIGDQDTVYNYLFTDMSLGFQTVVLCCYDLKTDEFIWTRRIGNVGEEKLIEMLIDNNRDLVILGETASTYFSFNDQDTLMNMSDHNPFIGKYSSSGEFLFGRMNPLENFIYVEDLFIDSENTIYWLGYYRGNQYQTEDTLLIRPGLGRPVDNQGIITRVNLNGKDDWVMQLEGDFGVSKFFCGTDLDVNTIGITGYFRSGTVILGDSVYLDDETANDSYNYILAVDKSKGIVKSHIVTQVPEPPELFLHIFGNTQNQLDLYMYFKGSKMVFDQHFESFNDRVSGWLVKISTDFLLRTEFHNVIDKIEIYPNPCRSGQFISVVLKDSNIAYSKSLQVINAFGIVMLEGIRFDDSKAIIPTDKLSPGLYWIMDNGERAILGKVFITQ